MSSRQLRKLRKQQELLEAQPPADSESEGDDLPIAAKPRGNAFAGFAALGDMGDDDDESEEAEQEDEKVDDEPKPTELAPQAKAKKAKKKKKKKAAKKQVEDDTAIPEAQDDGKEDEIDRALQELRINSTAATQSDATILAGVLRSEPQHLKVMNEMRNIFGRETIHTAEQEDAAEANQARRRGQRQMLDLEGVLRGDPRQKMSDVLIRRNPFIQWKETWPVAPALGLTMKVIEEWEDGITEFAFAHEAPYIALELQFFQFVETYNDQGMIPFLRANPYHVSTLLQISKLAKRDGNAMLMGDLVERALFAFGRVSLSSFRKKLEEGKARLDFRRPENRQFWLSGYHYIKCLMPKGTFRTALEWSKVLLSMSPDDDFGIINFVHVLAIKAHEAQWFLDLCGSPFFGPELSEGDTNKEYIKQTIVPAKLQLGDEDGARAALQDGIATLPWLYAAIFSALNLDTPKSIWGQQPRDSNDEVYTKLYVHTAKDLWNTPATIALLTDVTTSAPKPNISRLAKASNPTMPVARFIYLDGTTSLLSLLPPKVLSAQPNYDFDPLPPSEANNVFSNETQMLPWQQRDAPIRAGIPAHAGLAGLMGMAIPEELRGQMAEFEAAIAAEAAEAGDEDDAPGEEAAQGVLARMMNLVFGGLGYSGPGVGADEEDDNTDTDEEDMPPLLPLDEDDAELRRWAAENRDLEDVDVDSDSDDDLPALEPAR